MDVLTSAASAHEVASKSDADSPRGSPAQYEAQILALKRKLIECDRSLNSAHERISGLEKALDIEKREHQLCLLYTSPSPRDGLLSRMPSSA